MSEQPTEPYVPFSEKVEAAKEEAKQKAVNKLQKKQEIRMSKEEVEWAEKTHHLMEDPSFKAYQWYEAVQVSECLRFAFQRKSAQQIRVGENEVKVEYSRSFGEDAAYNEGFYHGMLKMKAERERIWMKYLQILKQKREEKP